MSRSGSHLRTRRSFNQSCSRARGSAPCALSAERGGGTSTGGRYHLQCKNLLGRLSRRSKHMSLSSGCADANKPVCLCSNRIESFEITTTFLIRINGACCIITFIIPSLRLNSFFHFFFTYRLCFYIQWPSSWTFSEDTRCRILLQTLLA